MTNPPPRTFTPADVERAAVALFRERHRNDPDNGSFAQGRMIAYREIVRTVLGAVGEVEG